MSVVASIADTITVLARGATLAEGPYAEVSKNPSVIEAYMGTFAGPVLGAFTIIGLQNLLSDRVGEWVTVIIGVIFVVCVVAFRRGFVGELHAALKKRANYTAAEAGQPSSEAR